MYKITLTIAVLSAAALAQTPARVTAPSQAAVPAGPAPTVAQLMRSNGGSLRRAALQLADDPRTLKPSDVNYFAVPEPKPKTLLKHDLVTIVISEQSQFSSDGGTDTKKDGAIGAKLEQFPA